MSNVVISLGNYNGTDISARPDDEFINATAMCQATGKRWADYWKNKSTQEFLNALAKNLACENSHLLYTSKVNAEFGGGTWVHRRVAIHLAQWCSADFAVWVSGQIENILLGKQVSHKEHAEAHFISVMENCIQRLTDNVVTVGGQITEVKADVTKLGHKVADMSTQLDEIQESIVIRKHLKEETKRKHVQVVHEYYGGRCPCCRKTRIVDDYGIKLINLHFDHFFMRSERCVSKTWAVCNECNASLRDGDKRREKTNQFTAYQDIRRDYEASKLTPYLLGLDR